MICITVKCKNEEERKRIGEIFCTALAGSPAYINNEILVNYTKPDEEDVILIVGESSKHDSFVEADADTIETYI